MWKEFLNLESDAHQEMREENKNMFPCETFSFID